MAIEARFGHRDCLSDDPQEFKAWSENFIQVAEKNKEKWGIPAGEIEKLKMHHAIYLATLTDEPPPEPDPIDGYTIYWDKHKRFLELMGDFLEVPLDSSGAYDMEVLKERMLNVFTRENGLERWKEYLAACARKTAERYGMGDEWLEAVRTRAASAQQAPAKNDDIRNLFFMLYQKY
jgi:hypothetical protein